MRTLVSTKHRSWFVALGLALLTSCGGGGGGAGPGGETRNFASGKGFDNTVHVIVPALDGSGDVYVGGEFTQYDGVSAPRLARLNRGGSLDSAFDIGTGFGAPVFDIEPIDDGTGDLYVGGDFTSFRGNSRSRIVRVNPDGTEGFVDFGNGFDRTVASLALNGGLGDLYAGGSFSGFRQNGLALLARVDPDGTGDNVFDTGTGFDPSMGPHVFTVQVARDGSGDIYVGGTFESFRGNSRNNIVRINPDGSNDGGFDPGSGFDGRVEEIALATDGTNAIYAVGTFSSYRGNSRAGIARITPLGADDPSFITGTGIIHSCFAVAVANDGSGDVYVGGAFADYNGAPAFRIARLNSDGSLDAGFATGSGFDGVVYAIAPAPGGSGDVLVGGAFTQYNGTPVGNIVRLNADGSLD